MAKDRVTFELKGTKQVIANLNKEAQKLYGPKGERALIQAAVMIRRDMDKTPPKIPVDTGNLRGSWTTILVRGFTTRVGIIMGFTANYAAKVHFSFEKTFRRPDSGPLFFTTALKRNTQQILKTFAESLKI